MNKFHGRLALQQRVLPNYRVPFFDLLASSCADGMSLFAGLPRPSEGIISANQLAQAKYVAGENIHILKGPLYLCYQKGLSNWLVKWDPDALVMEANPRYLSSPSAVKWMHKRNKPVIGWGLGAPHGKGIGTRIWSSFVHQFDALIAYSRRGADEYAGLGFPRERIFVAHNSVSPAPSHPMPIRPVNFDSQPCMVFVGRLQARKRVDHLLRACAKIKDLRLVIIGDGPERANLESLAKEIYPTVEFIGAKHGGELKPYFEAADLFVLPGTGGLAVQEAMSYGLPIIVAKGDGTQDDLVREENGWQIKPDDLYALVSTMKDALSDPARLRNMGEASYRLVKDEINIEKMVDVFVAALNTLTGE